MKRKNKSMLVIRRSGYYVNVIPNMPQAMRSWMEQNLTRTDPNGRVLKDGAMEERPLKESMKVCCVSFTPVTATEAAEAPLYVRSLSRSSGLVGC